MARFNNGWVKLHRSILTSAIGRDGTACWIFAVFIIWANRAESRVEGEILARGQLVTGIDEIAFNTGFNRMTVSRKIKKMEQLGMISRHMRHKGSVITVLNFDKYQSEDEYHVTEVLPTCDTPVTQVLPTCYLNGELENSRIKELKKNTKSPPLVLPLIAQLWNTHAHESLARVKAMGKGSNRRKMADSRYQEFPDEAYWVSVIERISKSGFCLGQNDRGWKADFDFLVRTDTHSKVMEGKYDSRTASEPEDAGDRWLRESQEGA
jgi:hypothetical protein